MPELIPNTGTSRFNVFGVRKDSPHQPLIQLDLPWQRLMEDIVVPFEAGETFFLDGAPVKATDLDRIKILLQDQNFGPVFHDFHRKLRMSDAKFKEIYTKQYHVFLEAMLRERCIDVTSQVINAFQTAAKPKLGDRLPDRNVLWDAAFKLVTEGLKAWTQQHGG